MGGALCGRLGLLSFLTPSLLALPPPLIFLCTVYVRSPHGHDLGAVLKKAVFTLHPSFLNHIRGTFVLCLRCLPCPPLLLLVKMGSPKRRGFVLHELAFLYEQETGNAVPRLLSIRPFCLSHAHTLIPHTYKPIQRWQPTRSK